MGIFTLFLWLPLACTFSAPTTPPLSSAAGISYSIAKGETLSFSLLMSPGDLLRVRVDQHSVDLTLTLRNSRGDRGLAFDSENGTDGPEWLLASAVTQGEHFLEISAIAGKGSLEIIVENLGIPTKADLALIDALDTLRQIDVRKPHADKVTGLRALLAFDNELLPGLIRARIQAKLGRLLSDLGAPIEALEAMSQAVTGFERFGNAWELAPALNQLSNIQSQLGQLDNSETTLYQALEVGKQADFPAVRAATWNNLGVLYSTRGEFSEALGAYQQAETLYSDLGHIAAQAETLHNLGSLLLLLGRIEEGRQSLQKAVEHRRETQWPLGEARALAALGWALELDTEIGNSSYLEALSTYDQAIEIFESHDTALDLAQALERRGEVHRRLGRLEEAQEDLEYALKLLDPDAGPMQEGWIQLGLGAVLSDRGGLEEAYEHLTDSIRNFDQIDHPAGQVAARAALARVERSSGQRKRAAQTLEAAIKIIESSRRTLRTPQFRRTFLVIRQEVYLELVDLWASASHEAAQLSSPEARLRAQDFAERAFEAAERAKARTLLDQISSPHWGQRLGTPSLLESRQIVDALEARQIMSALPSHDREIADERRGHAGHNSTGLFGDLQEARLTWERRLELSDTVADPQVEPAKASDIYPLLDPNTYLLAFSLNKKRSWAFSLKQGEIQVFQLSSRQEIEAAARRTHVLLPKWGMLGFSRAAEDSVQTLTSLVFDPIGNLEPETRLLIVPDGALHLVPFGLLLSPIEQPLLSAHDIVHLPSASVLPSLRERSKNQQPTTRFLASVADPVFEPNDQRLGETASRRAMGEVSPGSRHLPRLLASRTEAKRVLDLAREARPSQDSVVYESFSADRNLLLQGELSNYRFLHFATHGLIDAADPQLAGLAFSNFDQDGGLRTGYLPARALYDVKIGADLVVLSACRSAVGQQLRGEGLIGLSHGFFVAGAQHLIASLWDVDDDASAELMFRFYRHLFQGEIDPAEALRLAQLEIRDETIWRDPKYWAGFIAIGDWELGSL